MCISSCVGTTNSSMAGGDTPRSSCCDPDLCACLLLQASTSWQCCASYSWCLKSFQPPLQRVHTGPPWCTWCRCCASCLKTMGKFCCQIQECHCCCYLETPSHNRSSPRLCRYMLIVSSFSVLQGCWRAAASSAVQLEQSACRAGPTTAGRASCRRCGPAAW